MDLPTWQHLMDPANDALRNRAAAIDPYSTAAVTSLRRDFDKDLVHAALALAKARDKAKTKFGDAAAALVADPDGVEMASSRASAAWKARRFSAPARPVLDLCCGIGGDAMALRAAGLAVTCIDSDPARAWMAAQNARCTPRCASVESLPAEPGSVPPPIFHIDPARRTKNGSASARVWTLADVLPGPETLRAVVDRFRDGAVKLAPGVSYPELATAGLAGEVEIISERGGLTQAVLWTGALARATGVRTATLLRGPPSAAPADADVATLSGQPDDPAALPVWPATSPAPKHIFEVDDSVERAELLTALCRQVGAQMLHPRLGLIAADALLHNAFLKPFELLESAKWNEQRAAAALKRLGAGSVEVKTRAKAVNPDELQPALTKAACVKGGVPLVLFVLRFGSEARMLIARRVSGGPGRGAP